MNAPSTYHVPQKGMKSVLTPLDPLYVSVKRVIITSVAYVPVSVSTLFVTEYSKL